MHPTALSFILFLAYATPIHEWYDMDCCNERHCHPVPDGMVSENKNFVLVPGFAPVPKVSPKNRWSHDTHDHICTSDDGQQLYCIYRAMRGL
jgi:hypothetical protein